MEAKIDFISKFTFVLFGIFISSVIFALSIKALGEIGIYLSLLLCGGIAAFGVIYFKNSPRLRLTIYGMITMIAVAIIVLILSLGLLAGIV